MKQRFNYFKKGVDNWTKDEAIASYINVYGNDGMKYLLEDLIKAKKSNRPLNAARANELFSSILGGLDSTMSRFGSSGSAAASGLGNNNNNNNNNNEASAPDCTVHTGDIINHGFQSIGAPLYHTSQIDDAVTSNNNDNNNSNNTNKRRRVLLYEDDEAEEQETLEEYFNRDNNSNPILSDNLILPSVRDSLNDMDNINIGNRPNAEHEYKINDTNMAVTHILLLKKGEYSPTMLKVFKEDDLDNMAKELRKTFIVGDRFDKDLKVEIEELLERIDDFTEEELQDVADEMNNKAHEARVEPSEADLVTSFLEQLLRPLLSSRKSRLRWPNAKAEISTTTTSNRSTSNRPDAKISNMCGINYGEARAFGEVKPDEHAKDNYLLAKDLSRLCVFGKDSIDKDHMYATMLFQAVGHSITFYASALVADGTYVVIELETIKFPESLKELKLFGGSLNGIINVLNCFEKCNVDKNNKQQLEDMARDTLDTPSFRNIIDPTKSKTRLRHVNFN
ncbi:hypothetical protein INT45_006303 [Circinella minor]|uniref:Uncharacterized protein n=1 Tax=Circinella minor TaxID=1195481 RepID=A0A8H7VH69_9FUNG|nr:hypothetical protein INT45_006303 [Circinella minor]